MNLIKCIGKEKVKKLENSDEDIVYIAITDILKRKHFPKKARVQFYWKLLPPPNTINTLCTEGSDEFKAEYKQYINRPECMYLINEIMSKMVEYDLNVAFVIALDEDEFEYLDYVIEDIEDLYGIKAISVKKFLAGKTSPCKRSESDMMKACKSLKALIDAKLADTYVDPVKLFLETIHEDDIKSLPKDLRSKAEVSDLYRK